MQGERTLKIVLLFIINVVTISVITEVLLKQREPIGKKQGPKTTPKFCGVILLF